MGRLKIKRGKKSDARTITELKMSSRRTVTDPEEIRRLLIADGFTVDDNGKIGVGPKLSPQ